MSSFDKVVKNACKPKAAAPKSKYLDPIIAATWSEDGAVHDVCRALAPRFREPNVIVVFKALIVLHTMIRNGSTDNILQYLSSSDVLRLKNVSTGQWEGYHPPANLQSYAIYLDARIRGYRELKHDAVRVQSESNRDARLSMSLEEEARRNRSHGPGSTPSRSKTMSGRKLRVMTVEKGLLRETKVVQKMIDALVECRFYLDDLEDELTITALRMLVKDLLVLFQAGNEGVINVLEHYFEMSHVDATSALTIYRHFCKQTESVVEYLGVAKKLQNLLNVSIPNLKHAPVSLVGSLEEYLNDPNFEQNRIEYKANKDSADRNLRNGGSAPKKTEKGAHNLSSATPPASTTSSTAASSSATPASKPDGGNAFADFFSAIEEEQPTMFNPQTGSPTSNYFTQQAAHNPFAHAQANGFQPQTGPFGQSPFQPQQTGFIQPQFTAIPPFQQQQQLQPFAALQSQPTGFLQPQTTGANPFRQTQLFPQSTGLPFGTNNAFHPAPTGSNNPFPAQSQPFQNTPAPQPTFNNNPFPSSNGPFQPNPTSSFSQHPHINGASSMPARPASTPITSFGLSNKPGSPPLQPVKSHQTGSRNPFGVPTPAAPPPVPKAPTLFDLATRGSSFGQTSQPQQQQQSQQEIRPQQTGFNGFAPAQSNGISNIASSFLSGNKQEEVKPAFTGFQTFNTGSTAQTATSGSGFSDSVFSSLSSQPTGATSNGSTSSPLQPQTTGFGGIKAFKPTSSFGASLLEPLPPIPQSPDPSSPPANASSTSGSPFGSSFASSLGSQPTGAAGGLTPFGSSLGVGLRPQATGAGAGAANPFRASMFPATGGGNPSAFGVGPGAFSSSSSTPAFGGAGQGAQSLFAQSTGMPGPNGTSSFGASLFGGAYGTQGQQQQQQQNGTASLI
ncbi:ANTH domain-containing protein [Amylostereum chailletii]|nr:ANTH domain-containing protein [Amylostereum chailletii]